MCRSYLFDKLWEFPWYIYIAVVSLVLKLNVKFILQPGANLVLPPNYQLPPGTMLVKNEQGQLMLVTQQQAQAYKVQARVSASLNVPG